MLQNLHDITVGMAQRSEQHSLSNIEFNKTVKYDPKKNLITIEGDVLRGFIHLFDYGTTQSLLNALHSAKARKSAKQISKPFCFTEMTYEEYIISATVEFKEFKSSVEISISARRYPNSVKTYRFNGDSTQKVKLPEKLKSLQRTICQVQKQYLELTD